VTYKCCWDVSKDGSVQTFDRRMGSWVEIRVQRNALETIEKPRDDGKHGVESHGSVNHILEGSVGGKTKVE
jgi:hypothetical protein